MNCAICSDEGYYWNFAESEWMKCWCCLNEQKKEKMRIRLEKIEERDDAAYPNNIAVGYSVKGAITEKPEVGKRFYVGWDWSTSPVQEIIDERTFKTFNSVYRWEIL